MKIQFKDEIIEFEGKARISEVFKDKIDNSKYTVVAATFNNEYVNLEYEIEEDGVLELIDISSKEGMKVYTRTLTYILGKAFEKLYPNKKLIVDYQLSNSMFYDTQDNEEVSQEMVENLQKEMQKIVEKNLPIEQIVMTKKEAQDFFAINDTSKGRLQLDLENNEKIYMYYCENYFNYCYGTLANRTGCINKFELSKYNDGFIIRYPSHKNPNHIAKFIKNKKLSWAIDEYEDIHRILNVDRVYKLNEAIEEDRIQEVILLAEALHEKKIANIADNIAKNKNIKMVLIAGPSSSGKTTFAQRLGIQLRLNKLKPVTISVDNYFVEREDTPRDENGEYDFECIEAIDLELFNDHLTKLLNGEEIVMPEFDFLQGTKRFNGKKTRLKEDEILVIEGIHCLNDKLTSKIPAEQKYKVYISALTVLNLDRFNRISTTDTRLIRRIVRDNQFRGYDAKHTISTWDKVNEGEEKNIFPFQEGANFIFNTSLIYELCALKPVVMPLLEEITKKDVEHAEAQRLINMLKYFKEIPNDYVPKNSLLKEFLGGGAFDVN